MKRPLVLICLFFWTASALAGKSFELKDDRVNHQYEKMCDQALRVLEKMKRMDPVLELEIQCVVEEKTSIKELFGLTNSLTHYRHHMDYDGSFKKKCSEANEFKLITVPLLYTHYSSQTGLPSGINPYLMDMLKRLELDHTYKVHTFSQESRKTMELVIHYPSCL